MAALPPLQMAVLFEDVAAILLEAKTFNSLAWLADIALKRRPAVYEGVFSVFFNAIWGNCTPQTLEAILPYLLACLC